MIVTTLYEPKSVLIAMFMTAFMVVALSVYAVNAKDEFNPSNGMMVVVVSSIALLIVSLIMHFT